MRLLPSSIVGLTAAVLVVAMVSSLDATAKNAGKGKDKIPGQNAGAGSGAAANFGGLPPGLGKRKNLPPGLAKRVTLPSGLAKTHQVPPGLAKRVTLPPGLSD